MGLGKLSEFLDSIERSKLGVNAASLIPYSPLRAYAMGNDAARDPKYKATTEEIAQIKHLLREGLEAGGFGFSGSFSMANRDYDGGYLPTHVATREEFLGAAQVLREFNRAKRGRRLVLPRPASRTSSRWVITET
jgi:N-acyl-D-amino-acid deacylase